MSCVVESKTVIKALTGENKFNGLALVSLAEKAWYVLDISSNSTADDINILLPDDGIGRWFKCNNDANILNSSFTYSTVSTLLTVDFTNYETIEVVFTQNCTINMQSTLRNGYGFLILNRNSGTWAISGWDNRMIWLGSSYNFTNGVNICILHLLFINNLIYVTKTTEFN